MELHISDTLGNRLLDLAHKDGYSGKAWAENFLARFVEDREDYRCAVERLEKNKDKPTIPWEELRLELSDDGLEN